MLSGITFFTYMMVIIGIITEKCEAELGIELWGGSYPRYVFKDGIFLPNRILPKINLIQKRKIANQIKKKFVVKIKNYLLKKH